MVNEVSTFRYFSSEKPAIIDTQHLVDITAESLSDQQLEKFFGKR